MSVEEIKFDCPACGEGLAIDCRAIGHQVACPFCKDPITVPEIETPDEISVEPVTARGGSAEPAAVPSLEELAGSRPEISEAATDPEPVRMEQPATAASTGEQKKPGGLPPRRKPGEKPRVVSDGPGANAGKSAMPPGHVGSAIPPIARSQSSPASDPPRAEQNPKAAAAASGKPNGGGSTVPEGFEEKVRRKRKRRNPDEHRLNPREHPKMVAFDEVVGDGTFRNHPAHGKMPFLKKLGVFFSILGIFAAIGLGILKQMQLREPDENLQGRAQTPIEKEFETVKARLNEFCAATSVADKMSFIRIPVTQMEVYPPLLDRLNDYYAKTTLTPHFPSLDKATSANFQQGEKEYFRVSMENGGIDSFAYFEKSATGYALDWDSFVGYNPKPWMEFLVDPAGESESGVFRLIVTLKDHYTGMYQDKSKYRSYEVTDINSNMHAIAYVVRGTAADEAIDREFKKLKLADEKRVMVIGQVNLVERGVDGSHIIYIEKTLRSNWLLP